MKGITTNKLFRGKTLIYVSFGLLAIVTIYSAWYANYFQSGNSDNLIYPYFFQHFQTHDIILPSQHANILKFPLFILQAIIPYTFTTFSIVSIGLVIFTIIAWAALLVYIFGRRYAALICLAFASILLGSQLLNYDLLGTTVRNIEFPIVLAFVICMGFLLQHKVITRRKQLIIFVVALLFSLTIAGDSFFLFTSVVSILAVLVAYWFFGVKSGEAGLQYRRALLIVLGVTASAFIIRKAIALLGIAYYYTADAFRPHVLAINHLGPSISTGTIQVLDLFDANIFGLNIRPDTGLVFMNFGLLLLGLFGLVYMLFDGMKIQGQKILIKRFGLPRTFSVTVIALTGLVTYLVYIASDLVVTSSPDGQIISAGQERYLTILPLVLLLGIVYSVWRNHDTRKIVFIGLPILISLVLLASLQNVKREHNYNNGLREGPMSVASVSKDNGLNMLVTGYWYGASTRFWSDNKISFSMVANCNIPRPMFNNRSSWYKPDPAIHKSALVVSRTGPDASYWDCTDAELINIYGMPDKFITAPGTSNTTLWVYNRDIRTSLKPFGVN